MDKPNSIAMLEHQIAKDRRKLEKREQRLVIKRKKLDLAQQSPSQPIGQIENGLVKNG